jgi:DNA-binding CsgD family transcriptional regulator
MPHLLICGFIMTGVSMLHLLRPSFVAGVDACRRRAGEPAAVAGMLDSMCEGALLADRDGKILHINRALLQATARDPEGQIVMDAMRRLAMRMGAILRRPGEVVEVVGAGKMVQTVTTSCGSHRIRGSLLSEGMLGSGAAVLVTMEALSVPANRSAAERIEQYRLTSAQTRVALLIAEGKTDKAIARELEISPNTVRHHAEQVRLKMGVGTRTEVTHRLLSN